jgi:hypothetical protein
MIEVICHLQSYGNYRYKEVSNRAFGYNKRERERGLQEIEPHARPSITILFYFTLFGCIATRWRKCFGAKLSL